MLQLVVFPVTACHIPLAARNLAANLLSLTTLSLALTAYRLPNGCVPPCLPAVYCSLSLTLTDYRMGACLLAATTCLPDSRLVACLLPCRLLVSALSSVYYRLRPCISKIVHTACPLSHCHSPLLHSRLLFADFQLQPFASCRYTGLTPPAFSLSTLTLPLTTLPTVTDHLSACRLLYAALLLATLRFVG